MTTRIVGPSLSTTPVITGAPARAPRELPPDLLRGASRRLGVMSLMGGFLWITARILNHFAMRALAGAVPFPEGLGLSDYIVVVSAAISFGLFVFTRRSTRSPKFMLDLGLAYLIVTAFAIGFMWHSDKPPVDWPIIPAFTWIGPLTLMFAAIIPTPPLKTLVASLLAVSMGPLGMLVSRWQGIFQFEDRQIILMHYPDYLLALVSVVISVVVTQLGQQVSRAREMGSYHVGELIGRGGMGEVYHATHRMLARPAAIKLIRPEMISRGDHGTAQLAIKRFRREAEVAANLQSPHTVALYDFGVTEDSTLYFVMELLEGMDLERLVRTHGALPPARVVFILKQVCESLEEAHAAGLVHRDIKPANIHVGRLGLRHDFVKVLDFGLVKSVDTKEPGPEHTAATAEGITPGTPDYMAPEMTLGDVVDSRADIYALGCVAYFMLTARPVFEAANLFHMVARHLNDAPVPPSRIAPQPIPETLESLVLGCLAKKPSDRPQTAALLARALDELPIGPWGEAQAAAWWEENA